MALGEFRQNLSDITGVSAGASHARGLQLDAHDKDNDELLGLASGSRESLIKRGLSLARSFADARQRDADRSRKTVHEVSFLTILDDHLDWLGEQIASREREFERENGEDWREDLALEILDPDKIPQRREGESMEAYRERLEEALIDEMLNPDGSIKDEYKDHPEYGRYAEWAQWKYDQRVARALKAKLDDPNLSEEERAAIIDAFMETETARRMNAARLEFRSDNEVLDRTVRAQDELDDEVTNVSPSISENEFL